MPCGSSVEPQHHAHVFDAHRIGFDVLGEWGAQRLAGADIKLALVQRALDFLAFQEAVTQARAQATSFQITPEVLNNPEAFAKFQQVQGQLSSALSRLMAVSENYPQLKADANFRDLQSQLEGTENRITVARQRYIASVQEYNVLARSFPSNVTAKIFGYQPKPSFTVENEKAISTAPAVNFDK